jgi:hypothetical protein
MPDTPLAAWPLPPNVTGTRRRYESRVNSLASSARDVTLSVRVARK